MLIIRERGSVYQYLWSFSSSIWRIS